MSRGDYTGPAGLESLRTELEDEEPPAPTPGGPFSALAPSMWPSSSLASGCENQEEDPNAQPLFRWDEFGFKVDEEDGPEDCSSKLLSIPFVESPRRGLEWSVELELGETKGVARGQKLEKLVREGVPHSLRPTLWPILLGAKSKAEKSGLTYKEVVRGSGNDILQSSKQIEKDLLRTMPTNICFSHSDSVGIPRLRRVLRGVAWFFPEIGYCQGMGMIASTLLLFLPEDDTFWTMTAIIEDLLPASYFSSNLWGVQADQLVLRSLITSHLPALDSVLISHDIELSLITLHWFLTIFASALHIKILVRVWDRLFYDGTTIMFKVALAMLKLSEKELIEADSAASIFNILSALPSRVDDVEMLMEAASEVANESIDKSVVEAHRRRHLAILMSDQSSFSALNGSKSVPKPWSERRKLNRSKSVVEKMLFGEGEGETDRKCSNVRQTELLVNLREAILRTASFFRDIDHKYQGINMQSDYTIESHALDHENYMNMTRKKRKRAKAILEFERNDDDELGFRKNDIITIISQKDEHCWVGELNGLTGWFPAKFVEVVDERSKEYSYAGDDGVTRAITDIVRGSLCSSIKQILEHRMRRSSLLSGPAHPWLFIEEAAGEEISQDYNSVFSRLVLCKTYRLDEDGKVLSPEELLYRCVHFINQTHDKEGALMDVKLRSLVCLGLNEQVLHLWLETLCSADETVSKWYSPHSFMASPGWVLVKCELRLLQQFSFQLSHDCELGTEKDGQGQLKEGVRDMLVKHHLFSWDL